MLRTLCAAVVAASLIAGPALAKNTSNAPVTAITSQPAAKHHVKHVKHIKHVKHVKHVKYVKHLKHIKQVKHPAKSKMAG